MIKIKVSFSFVIFAFFCIFFGKSFLLINYMLVLFLHEYAHAYVAYKLGYTIKNIKIIPFGISLNIKDNKINPADQIKIAIAGPLCNIICVVVIMCCWWICPALYSYSYLFCFAHIVTAVFNFLPCYPMDGGRILFGILSKRHSKKAAFCICKTFNFVVALLMLILFVWSCFYVFNINYLLMSIFIFLNAFESKQPNYDFLHYIKKNLPKSHYVIRQFAVDSDMPIYKLATFVSKNDFVQFVVIKDGKQLFSFFESKLEYIFQTCLPTDKVVDIKL